MQGSDIITKKVFTFQIDKQSQKEFEKFLKKAGELPRRRISHAVKAGGKIMLDKTKSLLPTSGYKMKFEDGNTWTPNDVKRNLRLKLEKGKRKHKRVVRVGIRDWRVDLYSNFIEYGYTTKGGISHPATHFMRQGLSLTHKEVEEAMVEDLRKSLDELR